MTPPWVYKHKEYVTAFNRCLSPVGTTPPGFRRSDYAALILKEYTT